AKLYDQSMSEYPGFMASRRNYDVAQGIDSDGRRRSGVLESSWRAGGASSAELAALAEFAQNPTLQVVEASAVPEFGRDHEPPRLSTLLARIHNWVRCSDIPLSRGKNRAEVSSDGTSFTRPHRTPSASIQRRLRSRRYPCTHGSALRRTYQQ